jgi:hypothetical protein
MIGEERRKWRQHRIALLTRLLRDSGIWWQVTSLAPTVPSWLTYNERLAQMHDWFYRALQDGYSFGKGSQTRVFWLNSHEPQLHSALRLRLTPEIARRVFEDDGPDVFVKRCSDYSWFRIDDAHDWLATRLDSGELEAWVRKPDIAEALRLAKAKPWRRASKAKYWPRSDCTGPLVEDGNSGSSHSQALASSLGSKPGVKTNKQAQAEAECERWLRIMIALGEQPNTKIKVLDLAKQQAFAALLSDKAFNRVWDKCATSEMKRAGARKKRR